MPDARSALQLNGIPMKGVVGSGKEFNTYYVAATSALTVALSVADVPGATASVVVPGSSATIIAVASFDITIAVAATVQGFLNWNGSDQTATAVFTNASGTDNLLASQCWIITGVAAGTYTAKLRASKPAGAGTSTVNNPNTTLAVLVIGNS